MPVISQTIQMQPLLLAPRSLVNISPAGNNPSINATLDALPVKIETQRQFLAQVLKIMADSSLVEVKILKSRELIQLRASIPVKPGQLVLLISTKNGLELQSDSSQAVKHLLRLLLPKQGSIKQALTSLMRATAARSEPEKPNTGKDINAIVQRVVQQLPVRQEIIKPELLRQIINNFGLIRLPSQSSSATATSSGPSSAVLAAISNGSPVNPSVSLQTPIGQLLIPFLKNLLQPGAVTTNRFATAQIRERVTEMLARIMLNQIKPQQANTGDEVEIRRTEIVARNENQLDSFQMQFIPPRQLTQKETEGEAGAQEQGKMEKKWTVRLSFDFPELGQITTFIVLANNHHLEMNFWIDRPGTFALVKSKREKLQRRLTKQLKSQGIDALKIEVFAGEAPQRATPLVASHLVNEVA